MKVRIETACINYLIYVYEKRSTSDNKRIAGDCFLFVLAHCLVTFLLLFAQVPEDERAFRAPIIPQENEECHQKARPEITATQSHHVWHFWAITFHSMHSIFRACILQQIFSVPFHLIVLLHYLLLYFASSCKLYSLIFSNKIFSSSCVSVPLETFNAWHFCPRSQHFLNVVVNEK